MTLIIDPADLESYDAMFSKTREKEFQHPGIRNKLSDCNRPKKARKSKG